MMFNKLLVIFWNWMLQAVILLEDPAFSGLQFSHHGGNVSFRNATQNFTSQSLEVNGMPLYRSVDTTDGRFEAYATMLNSTRFQRVSKISTWLSELLSPVASWVVGAFQRPMVEDGLTLADPWQIPDVYKKLITEQPSLVRELLSDPRLNILTRKRHIPPAYDFISADDIFAKFQENGSDPSNHANISLDYYFANAKDALLYLLDNRTYWLDAENVLSDAEPLSDQDSFFVSYIYEAENQYEKFLQHKKEEETATNSRLIYFNTELEEQKNQDRFQKRSGMFSPDEETSQKRLSRVCGRPYFSRRFRRLVNGRTSAPGQWPWMAYVAESTNALSKSWLTYHGCGGVLITEKKNDEFSTRLHVQLGTTEFYDPSNEKNHSDRYQVLRMFTHSSFDVATYRNDITLLELKNPVNFTYKVLPICLPTPGQDFEGEMAVVIGWGQLNYYSARVSRVQQYVDVPIISRDTCQRWYDFSLENAIILPGHLCAGYVEGGKDACKGDSGGPLVVRDRDGRWVLAGTVSYGFGCAEPFKPGLYSNVTHFLPWIMNIVRRRTSS